jgi:hypothetical protein
MANPSKKIKLKITLKRIMRAIESGEYCGFCTACGTEVYGGIEPDARGYECEFCGESKVFGAEELLLTGGA